MGAAARSDEVDPSLAVTANIVMLLAGIGFMGAIQDALSGFPLTAAARILEAMLATAAIIAGVSGGLTVGQMLGVDLGRLNPGVTTLSEAGMVVAPGAAVCAGCLRVRVVRPASQPLLPIALIAGVAALVPSAWWTPQGFGRGGGGARGGLSWGSCRTPWRVGSGCPPLVVVVSAIVPCCPACRSTGDCPCSPTAATASCRSLMAAVAGSPSRWAPRRVSG